MGSGQSAMSKEACFRRIVIGPLRLHSVKS
jgi:hypothetical protein